MNLSLRFVLPLGFVLGLIAYGVIPLVDSLTLKWFVRDLEMRSTLMVRTMEGPLSELLVSDSKDKILAYFTRIMQDERLYALGFCDLNNRLLYQTQTYPDEVTCESTAGLMPDSFTVLKLSHGPLHMASASI